jgi:hypothetical protein
MVEKKEYSYSSSYKPGATGGGYTREYSKTESTYVPGSTSSRYSSTYDKSKSIEDKKPKLKEVAKKVERAVKPRESVSFAGLNGAEVTTTQKFLVSKLIKQSSAAGLTEFRFKFRTGLLRLVQRTEK